jgi:FtsP/CotA-like multicopper oxidase with cupredoxin domain
VSTRTRIVFAALALVILVVAVVALRPKDDDTERPAATPAATATATPGTSAPDVKPTETPAPTVDPGPLLTGDKVTDIRVTKGDTVRFRVLSPVAEEVHVHGYDLKKELEPGKVAQMSFKATIDGIFEIEFENSGTQIASLRVDPD